MRFDSPDLSNEQEPHTICASCERFNKVSSLPTLFCVPLALFSLRFYLFLVPIYVTFCPFEIQTTNLTNEELKDHPTLIHFA